MPHDIFSYEPEVGERLFLETQEVMAAIAEAEDAADEMLAWEVINAERAA